MCRFSDDQWQPAPIRKTLNGDDTNTGWVHARSPAMIDEVLSEREPPTIEGGVELPLAGGVME